MSAEQAREAFEQQVRALVEGGVDLIVVETMMSLAEVEQAMAAVKEHGAGLKVLVMVTVDEAGRCLTGTTAEDAARRIESWGADAVGCNCSSGPAIVLGVIERMRAVTTLPLAAMPNAGAPRDVDGRQIYMSSPEFLGSFAKRRSRPVRPLSGVAVERLRRITRAMRASLRALGAMEEGVRKGMVAVESKVSPPALGERSKVGAMVAGGEWITLVEIVPPKGIDCSKEIEGARLLHRLGGRCDQCSGFAEGECADVGAESVCADSAADWD